MTDPTHALYGRRFEVISIVTLPEGSGYVDVFYKEGMRLRIELQATQLGVAQICLGTKLTLESVTELVTLFSECDVIPCPSQRMKSGNDYLESSRPASFES